MALSHRTSGAMMSEATGNIGKRETAGTRSRPSSGRIAASTTDPAVGRLDVGVGQPGVHRPHRHLDRELAKKASHSSVCMAPAICQPIRLSGRSRTGASGSARNVGGAGLDIYRDHPDQHRTDPRKV